MSGGPSCLEHVFPNANIHVDNSPSANSYPFTTPDYHTYEHSDV